MITSKNNAQIKQIQKLQNSRKTRDEAGYFVIEGLRMFREIPREMLVKAYITESFFSKNTALVSDIEYELISEPVLKAIADTKTPQGVVAIVKQPAYTIDQIIGEAVPCIILLENLQDPGNLGTIIRTAEAANVTGIIISKESVDIFSPKVVRSTMGSIFRVAFVYEENLLEIINRLHKNEIDTYAAHLTGQDFYQEDYKKGCAFLIGNEGNGLSDALTKEASHKIKIPMGGKVESLNAAIATTVLVYEAMRQRHI